MRRITLHRGDITTDEAADAIVTAANSAGVYGYPLAQAAAVAIEAVTAALDAHPQVGEARFWLFDERANDAFADALGALG